MRILVMSLGTRGDVEPMIAIAEILSRHGHDVTCAFSEQLKYLVEDTSLSFISQGPEYMKPLKTHTAKIAIGGNRTGIVKFIAQLKLMRMGLKMENVAIRCQSNAVNTSDPDLIIHNGLAIYPFIWSLEHPDKTILVSAVPYNHHYVREHAQIIFRNNYGPFINKLTYKLALITTIGSIKRALKYLEIDNRIPNKKIKKAVLSTRTIYAISNSLFTKPDYWNESLLVSGFFDRKKIADFRPDINLLDFTSKHDKILLLSFGSMINPHPEKLTKIFVDILQEHHIPAIIVTASGSFVPLEYYDDNLLYFIKYIPFPWILPLVYGVIHHGGSGTLHSALKYGCPSLAIPHFIDQFLWNKIIYEKGLGPKGVKITKINKNRIEPLILDLYNNSVYKRNAEQIAFQMAIETSEQTLYDFIINRY